MALVLELGERMAGVNGEGSQDRKNLVAEIVGRPGLVGAAVRHDHRAVDRTISKTLSGENGFLKKLFIPSNDKYAS